MARDHSAQIAVGLLFSLLLAGAGAHAADIEILTSTKAVILNADADDDLNAFYLGLGANSSLHTGAVAAADLSSQTPMQIISQPGLTDSVLVVFDERKYRQLARDGFHFEI